MYPHLSGENVLLTFVCSSFVVVKSVWCYSKKILWVDSPYLLLSCFKFLRIDLEIIGVINPPFSGLNFWNLLRFFRLFSTFCFDETKFDFLKLSCPLISQLNRNKFVSANHFWFWKRLSLGHFKMNKALSDC